MTSGCFDTGQSPIAGGTSTQRGVEQTRDGFMASPERGRSFQTIMIIIFIYGGISGRTRGVNHCTAQAPDGRSSRVQTGTRHTLFTVCLPDPLGRDHRSGGALDL